MNQKFEAGTYGHNVKRDSWLRRNGKKIGAIVGLSVAGVGLTSAVAAGVKANNAADAKDHLKEQSEIAQVVQPGLNTIGNKVLTASHEHPKSVEISNTNIPGEVKVSAKSEVQGPGGRSANSFTVIMKLGTNGAPDPNQTIYAGGYDADYDASGSNEAIRSTGFDLATADAAQEGHVVGTDLEDPSDIRQNGWYAGASYMSPATDGSGSLTGRTSATLPGSRYNNYGDPISAAEAATSVLDTANREIDRVLASPDAE